MENIYYTPDDETLESIRTTDDKYNLVLILQSLKKTSNFNNSNPTTKYFIFFHQIGGVVYFNYKVAKCLYSISLHAPIEACTYLGIDNGALPLSVILVYSQKASFLSNK